MSGYIYLASAYSHPDSGIVEFRYRAACAATLYLIEEEKRAVHGPICMSHGIATLFNTPKRFDFWREQDLAMVRGAAELRFLNLEGYHESVGVQAEIAEAKKHGVPVVEQEWTPIFYFMLKRGFTVESPKGAWDEQIR